MLFDAHTRAFQAFGGVPRRGIYDNMKTAVDKVHKGKERTVNARFDAMCGHYLFEPDFCNVASGWEKGIVEKISLNTIHAFESIGYEEEMRLACQCTVTGDCTVETKPAMNFSGDTFWQKPYPNK